ncbi:MAG: TIGR03862 family flavoprotein [Burkholderiaceae bacterium]
MQAPSIAVVGGGPAGLMAAEVLAQRGLRVDVFDAMPSVGRKFLLAGKGGLNLTHAEPIEAFASRYGSRRAEIEPLLAAFGPAALRDWAHGLGISTFVGSSQRIFPAEMKAAPLLRRWLQRLRDGGVRFHMRHRWIGWLAGPGGLADLSLRFAAPDGERTVTAQAVVLALGGASWSRLGSDGAWTAWLSERGIELAPLRPANCGFDAGPLPGRTELGWSEHFRQRFAGQPLKSIRAWTDGPQHTQGTHGTHGTQHTQDTQRTGDDQPRRGECVVTETGLEGSLVYAFSAALRDKIAAHGQATLWLDLSPDRSEQQLAAALERPRGAKSMANHLRAQARIDGVKAGLLRELLPAAALADPRRLAAAIKALPLPLAAPRPIDEAISSAGGVSFESLDARLMLRAMPGVFCAGEMLDWEAPTGGYLLTACMASGRAAGLGVASWLDGGQASSPAPSPAHATRPAEAPLRSGEPAAPAQAGVPASGA